MCKTARILNIVIGTIFLLSGFSKAIDVSAFADLIGRYWVEWLGFASPIIILGEILLGMLFVFQIKIKMAQIIGSVTIICFTIIYSIGLLFFDIHDCGCFGQISSLNTNPMLSYVRNVVILAMIVIAYIYTDSQKELSTSMVCYMAVILLVSSFMCGFSFRNAKVLQMTALSSEDDEIRIVMVSETLLPEFVSLSPDSTYMVFAFSYTCPFCLNSIGNVEQYQSMGYVDRVIGLAKEEPEKECTFRELFKPQFSIYNVDATRLSKLSPNLPTTFIIRHDTVAFENTGLVITPALLQ